MNREIKFRAFNTIDNEWYGDDLAKRLLYRDTIGEKYDREKWKIVQFTGLKDKNGKEIYEGDVVRFVTTRDWHGYIGCVVWGGDGCYELHTKDNTAPRLYMLPDVVSQMDVIGNIYENPELLNSGQGAQECDATNDEQRTKN